MTCKHNNCTIEEFDEQVTQFEVVNGNPTAGTGDEPTGHQRLEVVCHDCGLVRTYKKYPKWLKAYLAKSVNARDGQARQQMLDDEFDEEYD